jgi:hypothetical protein
MAENEDLQQLQDINRSAAKELEREDQQVKAFYRGYGEDVGYEDPNTLISPRDLHGRGGNLGVLYEMRYSDPIIASTMDFRRDSVGALKYDIVPRSADPSAIEREVCEAVSWFIEKSLGCSLSDLVADIYDQVFSFGFYLAEPQIPLDGPDAGLLKLHRVPSYQVAWFNVDKHTRTYLTSVKLDNGDTYDEVDADRLIWYGNSFFPGNYWGMSDLRKLLSIFSAKKQDLLSYLTLRRLQSGILYFQENGEHPNNVNSWNVAKTYLQQYFRGQASPLILNAGLDLKFQSADIPALNGFEGTAAYFDSLMREALGSSLKNLGIGGAGGAYALGKELAISDAEQFRAHVNDFLELLDARSIGSASLMPLITTYLGFPERYAPRIVAVDNTSLDEAQNLTMLRDLIKDGILTVDQLPAGFSDAILEKLGFGAADVDVIETNDLMLEAQVVGEAVAEDISSLAELPESFAPTDGMREEAAKALNWRRQYGRGGTEVGVARARDISNGRNLSLDTVKRMHSYFSRHEVDKEGTGFKPGQKGFPSAGRIAWGLWGGNEGQTFAANIMRRLEAQERNDD